MTLRINLGDDDGGFAEVTAAGLTVRLDLFAAHATLLEYHNRNRGAGEVDYARGLAEAVRALGFPDVSTRTAFRLMAAVSGAVAKMQQEDGTGGAAPDQEGPPAAPAAEGGDAP